MPLSQNVNALIGAGILGVVCAATIYIIDHFKYEKQRHGFARDVERLNSEICLLREELNDVLDSQKQKALRNRKKRRRTNGRKTESVISDSTCTDEYPTALDSSDMEFYDLSDDEGGPLRQSDKNNLESELAEIDRKLDNGIGVDGCLDKLKDLCIEYPENPHLLWRIGKCHYKLLEKSADKSVILDHIAKGIDACTNALTLTPELADSHKWLAILVGSRSDFQSNKDKLLDGQLFKKHLDRALELNPADPPLHHMMGRFIYEYAKLKWYERKAASLIGDVPDASYDMALEHFARAEALSKKPWKENKLLIAKCKLGAGDIEGATQYLEEAHALTSHENDKGDKVDQEISELINKYR